jgi:hypothetical protein
VVAAAVSWVDDLDGDSRKAWDSFVAHARREAAAKIAESAFVISLVPGGEPDIKYAVELGLSIMLDKPLLIVVAPGVKIPERLRRVADELVVADLDVEAGREALHRAIERMNEA